MLLICEVKECPPSVVIAYLGPFEQSNSMVENKMAAAKLGFEIYALTTIPERADVGDEPARPHTNSFGKGRATGKLLIGSRVITM